LIEIAAAIEATALAQFLKGSTWVYPLVNAGHLLGVALLIGAVVPLDIVLAGILRRADPLAASTLLRPFAIAGFLLATGFGALLFITQASDYVRNPVFLTKIGLIGVAVLNAALHARITLSKGSAGRLLALVSLALWPLVLLLGRLVGYSIG
jgi:putative copper export protein